MPPLITLLTRTLSGGRIGARSISPSDQQLHHLLSELGAQAPAVAARRLAAELPRLICRENLAEHQLKWLDTARKAAEGWLPIIEREIERTTLPLTRLRTADALAADNLLKVLAGEYQRLAFGLAKHSNTTRQPELGPATLGAVRLLLRRQRLACRAGKAASSGNWRRLHRLYGLARDLRYADFADAAGSIETDYLAAVLQALAEPTGVTRAELPALLGVIDRLAPLARLRAIDSAASKRGRMLRLSPHDDRPSLIRPEEGTRDAAWQIDLDPVIDCLQSELRAIELAQVADPAATIPAPRKTLLRLLECWRRQPVRRFSRQSMRPRVDVVTGLDHLWWSLSRPQASRRPTDTAADETSEWVIANESADGFGLCQIRGARPDLDVGDLIGVGLRDVSRLHLCIVRRIDEDQRMRCQLGVQHLSPDAEAVVLVDAGSNRQQAVVRFSRLPALGGRAGVAAAAGQLATGAEVHIIGDDGRLIVGDAYEDNARHALHLIEPAEHNA